jgi:hypothetical protein
LTLFAIGGELQALQELLVERDGDVTDPEIAAAVDAWFATIAADEGAKLDGYIGLIRQNDMEAAAAKEESERWTMKARARENAAKRLKDRLKQYLEFTGRTKATSATGRVAAIQANGGKVPLTIADGIDPVQVDPSYQRIKVEFDTEKIRSSLEAGDDVGFARLEPRGNHLRIR